MRNELLIHSYERARNDQRYADWIAKGGPALRREQIAREACGKSYDHVMDEARAAIAKAKGGAA